MKKIILGMLLSLGFSAFAADWYVDAANYGQSGDGSQANPFGSLQEANDAESVASGDTVYVAEGTYDQGSVKFGTYSYASSTYDAYVRFLATKSLKFVATGSRHNTVIKGYAGDFSQSQSIFYQRSAIGCVAVSKDASGISFRGFIFREGVLHQSANAAMGSGGITAIDKSGAEFTAIDCVFDECNGRGGGAMGKGGIAIRCIFTHCGGNGFGSAAYGLKAYNCLFLRNGRNASDVVNASGNTASVVYNCELVNCLIFANGYHNSIRGDGTLLGNYYNVAAYDDDDNAAYTVTNGKFRNCAVREALGADVDTDATVVQLFPGVNQDSILYTNLCANAYTGDHSPVKGGFLDGTGNPTYRDLSWIPAAERNFYFDGQPMPADAATPIGLLLPNKTITSGPLPFKDAKLTINGKKILRPSPGTPNHCAIYQGAWPEQVAIGIAPGETKVTGYIDYGAPRFAGKDVIWQLLPPKHNTDGSLYAPAPITTREYEYEYWVDKTYEGADADGSKDKPFKKLQDAIDKLVNYKETLIHVAKGTYGDDQGFTAAANAGGVNTRIVMPAYKYAVIFATEGPEKTIIEGARASSGTNGTDAVRCIYLGSGADVAFCGFTIANGHVYGDNDTENSTYCGGAICCVNVSPIFYDCIITRSSGRHAIWNGKYFRCRIEQNDIHRRGVLGGSDGNAVLSSTLFANNINQGGSYGAFFNYVYSFNCSFAETNAPSVNVWNVNCRCLNAAVYANGRQDAPNGDGDFIGCVGASATGGTMAYPTPDNIRANPLFFNMKKGDYRLTANSPALKAGKLKAGTKLTYNHMLCYVRGDINNKKLVQDDGSINAGCYADAGVAQPQTMYVSPTGSDDNDGTTEAEPKQSLQAACDGATAAQTGYAQDIREVVALPGTYKLGSKKHTSSSFSGTQTIKSRVVVPAGITLRAKSSDPSETIIEGQDATMNVDDYGCGDDALRCAYVETNARLIGFTLKNGRTRNSSISGYVDDNLGAGAFGHGVANCFVEDCIIEGCVSRNGAAASLVTLKRCEVRNNCAISYGSVSRSGELYDCYIHDNYGCTALSDIIKNVVGCTYVNNYANLAKTDYAPQIMYNCGGGRMVNTVILGNVRDPYNAGGRTVSISNCVFGSNVPWSHDAGYEPVNCRNELTKEDLAKEYNADGRPLAKTSPSVDSGMAGQNAYATDIDGNQRVINGAIDIGAFEYDWINDYSAALGRRVTVTEYSAGVVEADQEKVTLAGGAKLTATVTSPGTSNRNYVIKALVPTGGTLTVKLNDEALGTLTADGSLSFSNALASNELEFEYAGTDACTVQSIAGNQPMYFIFK